MTKKNTEIALATQEDVSSLLQTPTADIINEKLAKGRMAAQIMEIPEGKAFEGFVVGPGQVIESTDKDEKDEAGDPKVQIIYTIRMRHESGLEVDIMQDYQLKKDLLPLVGKKAWIQRQPQKSIGKRRVNQWAVIDMSEQPGEEASA
jgi:hypothetical protein